MKVVKKQRNSRMCLMCGLDNPYGVRAPFYSMEDGSVITLFEYRPEHQSYPGRVHGGMIVAMLDEMGLRALWAKEGEETTFGVTASLETRFREPVPYGCRLVGRGAVERSTPMFCITRCTLSLPDGTLLAEAKVRYVKIPVDRIGENLSVHEEMCYLEEDGVTEIDI